MAGSLLWTLVKLVLTLSVIGGILYAINVAITQTQAAVASTKESLAGKGINMNSSGVAVKTDKRAYTQEETADAARSGIMKAWKSTAFNVPWYLQKTTGLGGSKHDKQKEEYEAKHGPKKHKHHAE